MLNGQGKLYTLEGILIYDGEWKDGKRNGHGKLYKTDGTLKFEGTFKDGVEINE